MMEMLYWKFFYIPQMIVILVFFIEVEMKNPDNINEKTKSFPFAPEKKILMISVII